VIISHRTMEPLDCNAQLRAADVEEVLAFGYTPYEALRQSMLNSLKAYMVEANGVPVAFWGYSSESWLSGTGYAWLLTTPEIEKHKYRFARSSKRIVAWLLTIYSRLIVAVHVNHMESRKWLEWLGFKYLHGEGTLYMVKER
jgi:hypothetical protein